MTVAPDRFPRALPWLAIATLAALYFVWPVTHTSSIRNTLLGLCVVQFGLLVYWRRGPRLLSGLATPAVVYLTLTAWLLVVALFISDHASWSLKEIRHEWLKSTLTLILGLLVGAASFDSKHVSRPAVLAAIIAALALHVGYIDLSAIQQWLQTRQLPTRLAGFSEHVAYANHVVLMFMTLLLAEAYTRLSRRTPALPVPNWAVATALCAGVLALAFASARNGTIEMACVFGLLVVLYWHEHPSRATSRRVVGIAALAGMAVLLAAVWGFRTDARTAALWRDIPVALDTTSHKAWLDQTRYALPKHPDGSEVNHSNYMRVAWFKEGIIAIVEHPLGVGYGRDAFGKALLAKYGAEGGGSTHSSLLDLTIGAGIPGLLLWCAFLASVVRIAWRHYRFDSSVYALALLLITTGYSVRTVLDAVMRDHVLEQFMFLVGLLSVWTVQIPAGNESPRIDAPMSHREA